MSQIMNLENMADFYVAVIEEPGETLCWRW